MQHIEYHFYGQLMANSSNYLKMQISERKNGEVEWRIGLLLYQCNLLQQAVGLINAFTLIYTHTSHLCRHRFVLIFSQTWDFITMLSSIDINTSTRSISA